MAVLRSLCRPRWTWTLATAFILLVLGALAAPAGSDANGDTSRTEQAPTPEPTPAERTKAIDQAQARALRKALRKLADAPRKNRKDASSPGEPGPSTDLASALKALNRPSR